MLRKKQFLPLIAVAFAAVLTVLFICRPGASIKEVSADPVKEKTQLQEELGEALLDYYIYGENEEQCRELLSALDELENYDCSMATGMGRQ